MKVFAKFAAIALASSLALTACKYEDGPRISLRSKRDRVANEWLIESMVYSDTTGDVTDRVTDPVAGFTTTIALFRTGGYSVQMVQRLKDTVTGGYRYLASHGGNANHEWDPAIYIPYQTRLPQGLKELGTGGTWAFEKGHYKIGINPDRSYDPNEVTTQKNPVFWVITKLKEKELHVRGNDINGKEFTMKLKALSDEPYFY